MLLKLIDEAQDKEKVSFTWCSLVWNEKFVLLSIDEDIWKIIESNVLKDKLFGYGLKLKFIASWVNITHSHQHKKVKVGK